ncbi:hypothetical protein AAMO2058_000351600 [Amorphochlora amoebiformis]
MEYLFMSFLPRVAKIAGPIKGVVQAIMLISKTVSNNTSPQEEGEEEEKMLSAVLMVPFPHVGRIIGKRGQRIKMLREESAGTTITIVANNVTISGRYEQLEKAVMNLTELLQEVGKRNPVSYAFPFENHSTTGTQSLLANQAALQYHMVQLAPDTMQVMIPSSSAGVVIGRGGSTIQRLKLESGASISLSNYVKGAENRVATISGTPRAMAKAILALAVQIATDGGNLPENSEALNIVLLVPPQELGAIIGKKGARITELRNNTSANINVADEGSVTIQGSTAAVSEAIKRIAFLLYETRNKVSNGTSTSNSPTPATELPPTTAKADPKITQANQVPSSTSAPQTSTKIKNRPTAATLFNSKIPAVDSKNFLTGILQNSLSSKFTNNTSLATTTTANPRKPASESSTNATYAQKTAGIKAAAVPPAVAQPEKIIAPIGMSSSYPTSGYSTTAQTNPVTPTMYHTFPDVHQTISQSQQGQPQVLLIGNHHWSPAPQPPQQQQQPQQQHPQSLPRRVPSERTSERKGSTKNPQPQLLSGLQSVIQQQPQNGQGSHQIQTQTFSSPFIQSNLGQNFYANASWYTPQRFQAYTENSAPIANAQTWQPTHRQQSAASPVVVPSSGIPMNTGQPVAQPPQSVSAEGLRSNDLWS